MTSRTVTVVIPVYNEERWIGQTLADLQAAGARAPELELDVLVVDDGSTDGSAAAARAAEVSIPLRVVTQQNAGRFAARARGLGEATGELVLFLDARVSLAAGSLEFVQQRLQADPDDVVWNAHVVIETSGNPYGLFWNMLTELAFGAYFDDPRTTYFDAGTFESFPKGTTCFLAPRSLVEEASRGHRSYYADSRDANDDTPMIRRIAEQRRIGISPEFSCTYLPRDALLPFVRHAFHRGIVFLDGHGRRGSRFLPAVIAFYPASVLATFAASRRPLAGAALVGGVVVAAGAVGVIKRRPPAEAASFAVLLPVYLAAHGLGMWRGLLRAARSRTGGRG